MPALGLIRRDLHGDGQELSVIAINEGSQQGFKLLGASHVPLQPKLWQKKAKDA
jgi:hypothetical protein